MVQWGQGVNVAYPFGSPQAAMEKLLLAGEASQAALDAKLALLTYYALDSGFVSDTQLLR